MNVLRKVELTAFQLKCIAVISMIIYYSMSMWVGFLPPSTLYVWQVMGLLAIPIMTFFVAEGYYCTKNVRRYALRLFVWAMLSQIPFVFYYHWTHHQRWGIFTWRPTDVIFTLLLGLLALTVWKKKELFVLIRVLLIAVLCALSWEIQSEWAVWGVLMVLAFGMFRSCYWKQSVAFFIVTSGFLIQMWFQLFMPYNPKEWLPYLGLFLPLLILWMYRGTKGGRPTLRWMFYMFYPVQFVLYRTLIIYWVNEIVKR